MTIRSARARLAIALGVVSLLALAVAVVALQLWNANLPFGEMS